MRKIYKSEIERPLFFPILLLVVSAMVFFLVSHYWILSGLAALLVGFLVHLYLNTSYELTTDHKLKVKSGFFFNKEIYINSIRKIRPAKSRSASPALSTDRLEIFYNRYGSVLISPEHKVEFIEALRQVNPRITVEHDSPRITSTAKGRERIPL